MRFISVVERRAKDILSAEGEVIAHRWRKVVILGVRHGFSLKVGGRYRAGLPPKLTTTGTSNAFDAVPHRRRAKVA